MIKVTKVCIYLSLFFVLFSCNKESSSSLNLLEVDFEINIEEGFFFGDKAWVVFSDLNGEIIDFGELPTPGNYSFQIETNEDQKFHATFINYRKPETLEDPWDIREFINLKTFGFLDGENATINLKSFDSNISEIYASAKTLDVGFNIEESEIKESVISGTLTGIRNTNNYGAVKVKEGQETVFTYVHLNGEDNWRMKFLEEVEDNTSVLIDIEEMEEVPVRIVQVPDVYDAEFAITGIIDCEENNAHFIQWFSPAENGNIISRYLPETSELFSHYRTDVKLTRENEVYQNIRLGAPISQYEPIEIDFSIQENSLDNFQLQTTSAPFSLYEINYSKTNPPGVGSNSSEWVIYGDFSEPFISPDLTEILVQDASWFNKDLLDLNEVKEYHYSNRPNYKAWLANEFDFELMEGVCFRDELNVGDQLTTRSLVFD